MSVIEKVGEFPSMLTMQYELWYKWWINAIVMIYPCLIIFVDYSTLRILLRSYSKN